MAKNRKQASENLDESDLAIDSETIQTKKPATANKRVNALIMPWLILFLVCSIASLFVCIWLEYDFSTKSNNRISDNYKQLFIDNTNAIISNEFARTQRQLDNIADNANIKAALASNDPAQINILSPSIQSSFNNSLSLQIIPWDITGTVGLKERNIEPRNNIEMVLLSRAGSKKETLPEVYQYNKEWIISFASPVIQDDTVIGVILLSLNKNYLADMINTPAITDVANISIFSKSQQKEVILDIGKGTIPAAAKLSTPFTDGELAIAFNAEKLQGVTLSFKPVHIAIGITISVMLVMCCIGLWLSMRYIKKDIHTMINFIDSLSALHKTKQPDLLVGIFSQLLNSITSLSERTTKTPITTEVNENYKSPQAVKPPEKPGLATVAEKNQFEHPEIFRDYDIRGLADSQLNTDSAVMIGKAIGTEAMTAGISTIISGRDGRTASERIQYDITRGILSTGCNVINIGMVPSPVLYFATEKLETGTGVMITGSHNPAEYNGVKIVINHKSLHGNDLQQLLKRIENYDFATGEGKMTKQDINDDYIQAVSSDIIIAKPLHIVVDAGNGVGGHISTQLLGMLDCQVTPLYCDVDGTFPNHGPDPSLRANLTDLINKVQELQADLGIAFDGDADRMVAVTATGQVINGDQLLMLFAKDIVSRNAASNIIYDVKCSANVEKIVSQYGGRAVLSKSGHSNMKAKMQETSALLGGEFTGHFFFKERWYGFDDGIYAAMRLIELITTNNSTLDEEISNLPTSCNTPELYITLMEPARAAEIIDKVQAALLLNDACRIDHTDGLRADFGNGWGLIRMSNTSPKLTMRFEAQNEEELEKIQNLFKNALVGLNMNLSIPF